MSFLFFFFNDTATTEIYTLSLHDALPIFRRSGHELHVVLTQPGPLADELRADGAASVAVWDWGRFRHARSEEHTSELQSRQYLVCRLLLEKKKKSRHHAFLATTHIIPAAY